MNRQNGRYLLECCVDSAVSARSAQKGGADRLELCSNLVIGGTTPSLALFRQIREAAPIPVHVLIRPRFGDFLYSEEEAEVMRREIRAFCQEGAEGVVIGCLTPEGELDTEQMKALIGEARGMSVTLHRAFDMCREPFRTLEEAVSLGVRTILTSGQAASCLEGRGLLGRLHTAARGRAAILAGGGVNAGTVPVLLRETGLTNFHMSGKKIRVSAMKYRNPAVSMGIKGISEYEQWETDSDEVAAVRAILDGNQGR